MPCINYGIRTRSPTRNTYNTPIFIWWLTIIELNHLILWWSIEIVATLPLALPPLLPPIIFVCLLVAVVAICVCEWCAYSKCIHIWIRAVQTMCTQNTSAYVLCMHTFHRTLGTAKKFSSKMSTHLYAAQSRNTPFKQKKISSIFSCLTVVANCLFWSAKRSFLWFFCFFHVITSSSSSLFHVLSILLCFFSLQFFIMR